MPNVTLDRSRIPELQLPEMLPDDIVRAISERLPDVDLSAVEWPKLDPSSIGKAVTDAAAAAHIGRRSERPRWPLLGGLLIAGVAGVAILSREGVRTRMAEAIGWVRTQAKAMLPSGDDSDTDAQAFGAADTMPTQPAAHPADPTSEAAGYPAGLGSNGHDLTTDTADIAR